MWSVYSALMEDVLLDSTLKPSNDRCIERNTRELKHILSDNLLDIKNRNEATLFRGPIAHVSAHLGSAVSDVKV